MAKTKLEIINLLDPQSLGAFLIKNIQEDLKGYKLANSNLYNSVNYKVKPTKEAWTVQVFMNDYAQIVDKGRRPGKMPPVGAILDWLRRKNIVPKNGKLGNLAWAIAKSIAKRGIRARPFLNNIFLYTDQWIDYEIKNMVDEISVEVVADIKRSLMGKPGFRITTK